MNELSKPNFSENCVDFPIHRGKGNPEAIKLLIKHGMNVNCLWTHMVRTCRKVEFHSVSSLRLAIKNNDHEIIQTLVHLGADVNMLIPYYVYQLEPFRIIEFKKTFF